MPSDSGLEQYADVEALFRRIHVGEIEKILNKLEQHYVKILEASTTIDKMLSCALSIEELFGQLEGFKGPEEDAFEPHSQTPESPTRCASNESYGRLETLWNQIHDCNYLFAAKTLDELRETLPEMNLERPIKVLLGLCRRAMGLLGERKHVAAVAEAIESVSLLRGEEKIAVLANHLENSEIPAGAELVTFIEDLCQISDRLSLERAKVIDPLIRRLSLTKEEGLKIALSLVETESEYLKSLANNLFEAWLTDIPPLMNFRQLFKLSCQLSQLTPAGLPDAWHKNLQVRLQIERPRGTELILAPIFGVPEDEELQSQDPEITESFFVPTGLPRVRKLGS